jgi:hypothetical protein
MVWIIEKWINGGWRPVRHGNGMPLYYPRKCVAQIALRALPRGRYRIISVRN